MASEYGKESKQRQRKDRDIEHKKGVRYKTVFIEGLDGLMKEHITIYYTMLSFLKELLWVSFLPQSIPFRMFVHSSIYTHIPGRPIAGCELPAYVDLSKELEFLCLWKYKRQAHSTQDDQSF